MNAELWLLLVALALALAAAGVAVGRASMQVRLRANEERVKASEDALARRDHTSEEYRRVQDLILGSMQEGVLLFDRGWRLVYANDALQRHLGRRPAAIQQLLPVSAEQLVERVAGSGHPESAEVAYGTPTRWLRIAAAPAGTDGSVLVVVTDITESRRIEQVRRDFVANASHELKTPAASIQAAAETLHDAAQNDPAAVARFSAQLERDARRLSRIVEDLLDLSRLETGSELRDDVDLGRLAREEVERSEEAAREAGVSIALDASPAPRVRGSSRDLALLVRNLVDNAVRYSRPGGTVTVVLASDDPGVRLEVRDDGVGIPTKDLPRIFERFYRVDRARSRETGGTGLGLAIVRHVAENHGGSVEVASELGVGSTFTVRLP